MYQIIYDFIFGNLVADSSVLSSQFSNILTYVTLGFFYYVLVKFVCGIFKIFLGAHKWF